MTVLEITVALGGTRDASAVLEFSLANVTTRMIQTQGESTKLKTIQCSQVLQKFLVKAWSGSCQKLQ